MTYYGWRVRFVFNFACGCSRSEGPIYQKFAYQYAGLGGRQQCKAHRAVEVSRVEQKIDGPHGEHALGSWKRQDGTRIFLEWEPATGWVTLSGQAKGSYSLCWRRERLVHVPDEADIWRLVGRSSLGGDRPEPAEEILARFRAAAADNTGPDDPRPGSPHA